MIRRMSVSLLALLASAGAMAQSPPVASSAGAAADSPASRAAVANRKAVFTLIGNNFRPLAQVLHPGGAPVAPDADRYASRLSFLADFLTDAFPDVSRAGDTRARPEIWSNRIEFEKRLRDFRDHTAQLAQAAARHDTEAVRTATGVVAQDCKSCHETYRSE